MAVCQSVGGAGARCGLPQLAHSAAEYVYLDQVHTCAAILAEAVARWPMMPRMMTTPANATHA